MRGCRTSARAAAYQGFVRPHLQYVCSASDPWTSNKIQQIEKVQRRAERFANRNYHDWHPSSVTQMIQDLNWEPLQIRRLKIRLVLLCTSGHIIRTAPKWQEDQGHSHFPPPTHQDRHTQTLLFSPEPLRLEQITIRWVQFPGKLQKSAGHLHQEPADQ
jgi:hypothetical protein